ncbi:hypothetical protein E4U42_007602 [Claviceps africana]|uniref:non-specific serine/threonine protein kinase n=1 Tax=Claviceps africana TaxID=83212 RepID=A0A8K0J1I4_9HYPO|nr:hypothetical protein E4U42_007602 [Claviceps africana]
MHPRLEQRPEPTPPKLFDLHNFGHQDLALDASSLSYNVTTPGNMSTNDFTSSQPFSHTENEDQPCPHRREIRLDEMEEEAVAEPDPEPLSQDEQAWEHAASDSRDDAAIGELVDDFTSLSVLAPLDTRIIIAGPPVPYAGALVPPSASCVALPRTIGGRDAVGVVQRMIDADCRISLSFDDSSTASLSQTAQSRIECVICYDPRSNDCLLMNEESTRVFVKQLSPPDGSRGDRFILPGRKLSPISTGIWRISLDKDDHVQHFVDVLLRPQRFIVSGLNPSGTNIIHYPWEIQTMAIRDMDGTRTVQEDGMESSYMLVKQRGWRSGSLLIKVVDCRHSALGCDVVVILYDPIMFRNDQDAVFQCAKLWKKHRQLGHELRHPNIVKMKSYDARLHALYMEPPPPRLSLQRPVPAAVARAVLADISAALVFLEERQILHDDISPHTVCYSAERGGVLSHFISARDRTNTSYGGDGDWYCEPPEIRRENDGWERRRGPFNDVWSLGITMLLCTGKIEVPKRHEVPECVQCTFTKGTVDYRKWQNWFSKVSRVRDRLNVRNEVDMVIGRMLDPTVESRITAAQIVSQLGSGGEGNVGADANV